MLLHMRVLPSQGCANIHESGRLALVRAWSAHARNRQRKGGARRPIQGARCHLAGYVGMVRRLRLDEFSRDTKGISLE
jgi:hypothetical protein